MTNVYGSYHVHSSFQAKHHVVATLDVSNVMLKRERPVCLKTGALIDGFPHQRPSALYCHFRFAEGLAVQEVDYIDTTYKVPFLPPHWKQTVHDFFVFQFEYFMIWYMEWCKSTVSNQPVI